MRGKGLTRSFREKSNPLLNEVFIRYSADQLAEFLGVQRTSVTNWRFIPHKHVDQIAALCDMNSDDVYQNSCEYKNEYQALLKKKVTRCSLSHIKESNESMADALSRAKDTISALKSREDLHDLMPNIYTIEKLIDFIDTNHKVKLELAFYIMHEMKRARKKMRGLNK